MPRHEYRCTCDQCGGDVSPNDENDVAFNGMRLVYCEECYRSLLTSWEMWRAQNRTAGEKP